MSFIARITRPTGTPRNSNWGLLNSPRRIIIHHTVTSAVPGTIPYHFVVHTNGTIHFGINTTHITGATLHNNNDSIMIAAVGNWDDRPCASNGMLPTNGATGAMSQTQSQRLTEIIADCLLSFPTIARQNSFNLLASQMNHFAMASRQTLAESFRRHTRAGIKGHDDALNEASRCPGVRLYNLCRNTIVPNAIHMANTFPLDIH